jgi:hypothetical protein
MDVDIVIIEGTNTFKSINNHFLILNCKLNENKLISFIDKNMNPYNINIKQCC